MERKGYYPLQTISFYISTYNLIVCFFLFNKPYGRFSQVVADINDGSVLLSTRNVTFMLTDSRSWEWFLRTVTNKTAIHIDTFSFLAFHFYLGVGV